MRRWSYYVALPLIGEVEAESEEEAKSAALDDAREALDWNREWWGAADVTVTAKEARADDNAPR